MNISIAICDDQQVDIDYLYSILLKWSKEKNIKIDITSCKSSEEYLFKYEHSPIFDILLLDIQMKDIDGIQLAKEIRKSNKTVQIIFITGYEDYISNGYDVAALHYLLKPVKPEKLFEVLDKAVAKLNKHEEYLLIRKNNDFIKTPLSLITYIEANAHKTIINTIDDKIESTTSISKIESQLNSGFIKCHRSYIVNIKYIHKITKTDVILDNNYLIPLSRRQKTLVTQSFITYHKGAMT